MGNDKTSWLDLDDDEDDLNAKAPEGGYTESLPAFADEQTHVPTEAASVGFDKTVLESGGEKTEIYHAGNAAKHAETSTFGDQTDPTVGWLVVVQGPGLGCSISLGAGMNAIGRDADERAALPFGDTLISGSDHLRIIYDDDNRVFYVAPGSGKNISRMNGKIIAMTETLNSFALLELSKKTKVRFVAFCGEEFDWSDMTAEKDD